MAVQFHCGNHRRHPRRESHPTFKRLFYIRDGRTHEERGEGLVLEALPWALRIEPRLPMALEVPLLRLLVRNEA